ncbi:unnamed protein product, partial [Iphiclides podalirius]
MSIKSQKSLNEECSEILEKSYSVRGLSDDSISSDDNEDCLSRELLRKISPAVLSKLRRRFKRDKARGVANIDRKVEEVMKAAAKEEGIEFTVTSQHNDTLWLKAEEFVEAIDEVFGPHKYSAHARQLCLVLDPLRSGRVRWGALLNRLLPSERTPASQRPAPECMRPLQLRHSQSSSDVPISERFVSFPEECIIKLVGIEREDSFCYVAVSKGGKVGVYSGQFKLLSSYECLAYSPCGEDGSSSLMIGTVRGALCVLRFTRPRVSLLQYTPDALAYSGWTELCSGAQRAYCTARTHAALHSRAVRRVLCERDARRVLSCSHDTSCSLRVRHASPHLDDYTLKLQRGASCFHAVVALRLVAVGSADGAVRLWSPPQSMPFAKLTVPGSAAVLDVAILTRLEVVVVFHSNCDLLAGWIQKMRSKTYSVNQANCIMMENME